MDTSFFSETCLPPVLPCPSGSAEQDTYTIKLNTSGVKELVKSGTTNTYEKIQSHLKDCLIYEIIERAMAGSEQDIDKLTAKQWGEVDFTNAPKSLAEAQQRLIDGEAQFLELPLEVRSQFGHDYNRFVMTAGTEPWLKIMTGQESPVDQKAEAKIKDPSLVRQASLDEAITKGGSLVE